MHFEVICTYSTFKLVWQPILIYILLKEWYHSCVLYFLKKLQQRLLLFFLKKKEKVVWEFL